MAIESKTKNSKEQTGHMRIATIKTALATVAALTIAGSSALAAQASLTLQN
jgi:hypothetical protein